MSALAEVLAKLASLSETDREWVLGQLSPGAKRKLLHSAKPEPAPPAPAPAIVTAPAAESKADDASGLIARASAATMREVLRGEPDWFVAALMGAGDWPWAGEYLGSQSSSVRWELEPSRMAPTAHMKSSVIAAAAAVLQSHAPAPEPTRFESILQRLSTARSRRRWSATA
jgi:hypothetical protein